MVLFFSNAIGFAQDAAVDEVAADDVTLDNALSTPPQPEVVPTETPTVVPAPEEPMLPPPPVTEPTAEQALTTPDGPVATESTPIPDSQVNTEEQASGEEVADEEQEDANENEVSEPVAPAVIASSIESEPVSTTETESDVSSVTYGSRMFGSKKLQLSMNKPAFTEKQKLLETLYGKPRDYFAFGVDWFPLDWWVSPGIAGKIGGFSWTGKAAKAIDTTKPISEDNMTVDENSRATLLFIPMQIAAKIQMTPFQKKWIVFDGWFGSEYGWWQETRPEETAAMSVWMAADSTTTQKPVLTNKGVSSAVTFGGSAHILLNWLDEKSTRSMNATMGLSSIYLSPFFESIKSTKTDGYTFGRNVFGLGFTFESVH